MPAIRIDDGSRVALVDGVRGIEISGGAFAGALG